MNMATSNRTLHQIRKNLPSTKRLVLFKTLTLSKLEYMILLFTCLSKTQISSLDSSLIGVSELPFFAKKIRKPSHVKTKHQIMSLESYLKYSWLNYLRWLPKDQIASFNNVFMFPGMQLKYNTRTLKLSSQTHTDSVVIRSSFYFFTRKQGNRLSFNERKQIHEIEQYKVYWNNLAFARTTFVRFQMNIGKCAAQTPKIQFPKKKNMSLICSSLKNI